MMMSPGDTKEILRQRLVDLELRSARARLSVYVFLGDQALAFSPARYFYNIVIPKFRIAFTKARCNALLSAVLLGRYSRRPYSERLCPCPQNVVETTAHIVLQCPYYDDLRSKFISPIFGIEMGMQAEEQLAFLLSDVYSGYITQGCPLLLCCTVGKEEN